MLFELIEQNKQYSNKDLINDLSRVANELGKKNVTLREYAKLGKFSYQTLKKRFGSWDETIKQAGLEERKRQWGGDLSEMRIPENLLVFDMQRVAKELNKQDITIDDYDKYGLYGTSVITKRFHGWNNAKKVADLEIGRRYNSTNEEYFRNLEEVWQKLGRQPRYLEISKPLSKFHISSYVNRFGSWRESLEEFIEYINSSEIENELINPESLKYIEVKKIDILPSVSKIPKRLTSRMINWRLRFIVMKRDNFKCKMCGRNPATDPSIVLHVDHIKAWANGGETILENLQTLCSVCNIGKSNLE